MTKIKISDLTTLSVDQSELLELPLEETANINGGIGILEPPPDSVTVTLDWHWFFNQSKPSLDIKKPKAPITINININPVPIDTTRGK